MIRIRFFWARGIKSEGVLGRTVLKEIGLSFLIHVRADSSTARAVATKEGASRKMKHIHTIFLFIQDLVSRKLFNDVISQDRCESE